MKIVDIYLEALRLMFVNANDLLVERDFNVYKRDEKFASIIANMPGALNRCFSDLENKGVLPSKTIDLNELKPLAIGETYHFDLSSVEDFFEPVRLAMFSDAGAYSSNSDFVLDGGCLVIPAYDRDREHYVLHYKPIITRVTSGTDEKSDVGVPDNIATAIPYFIKGDLFRDDEPNEAAEARNWYEAAIGLLKEKNTQRVGQVQTIYGMNL